MDNIPKTEDSMKSPFFKDKASSFSLSMESRNEE